MGCGSSRPGPEATPTGSSAPRPRPHISAPLEVEPYQSGAPFTAESAPVKVTLPPAISKSLSIGPDIQIQVTKPRNPDTARSAPVKVDLPPSIDAPEQIGSGLKRGKLNNHVRPRDRFLSESKSCNTLPYSWTDSYKPHCPDFKFDDVSPVDGSFPK